MEWFRICRIRWANASATVFSMISWAPRITERQRSDAFHGLDYRKVLQDDTIYPSVAKFSEGSCEGQGGGLQLLQMKVIV